MKASCEVVIDRNGLLAAVTINGPTCLPLGPEDMVIAPGARGIVVITASIRADLGAVGRWDRTLLVNRGVIERLLVKSNRASVRLILIGDRLQVDSTLIQVDNVGREAWPFRSLVAMPPVPKPQQGLLFPLVSIAEPLRPTQRQRPIGDLPLFAKAQAQMVDWET